jgi:hypothetical protein
MALTLKKLIGKQIKLVKNQAKAAQTLAKANLAANRAVATRGGMKFLSQQGMKQAARLGDTKIGMRLKKLGGSSTGKKLLTAFMS